MIVGGLRVVGWCSVFSPWLFAGWIVGGKKPRRKHRAGRSRADCGWIVGGLRVDALLQNDYLKANTPNGWVDLCDAGWQFAHARASGRRCVALQGGGRAWASREASALTLIFALCCVHFGSVLCSFWLCVFVYFLTFINPPLIYYISFCYLS